MKAMQLVRMEQMQERIVEKSIDAPVPQVKDGSARAAKPTQERIQQPIVEELADAPVSRTQDPIDVVIKVISLERVSEFVVEQNVGIPVPHITKEMAEVVELGASRTNPEGAS